MAGKKIISLSDVEKEFGTDGRVTKVIRGVSLDVYEGDYIAITGASGSGKSTLMYIAGLLLLPTAGKHEMNGKDVTHMKDDELARIRNTQIGFVFQQFNLLPRLTAEENVALPLVYAQVPTLEQKHRVKDALTNVDMHQYAHHRPGQLSGGQQQRVAIARALINEPGILLADEPTGALDSKTSTEVMNLFHQLHAQGRTVVIITHDPSVAEQCQRIIRINDGCIEHEGRA